MTELAIFDLDYTLTKRGTWGRFVAACIKNRPWVVPELVVAAAWMQFRYKHSQSIPRIAVKTSMMRRSMAGRSRKELEAIADQFVADDLANGLNPRVVQALRDHQAAGHTVLIASAGVDLLAERYCAGLEVNGEVSTQIAWTTDDRLANHFASKNCYGEQKMERVRAWLTENGIKPSHVTVYSDTCADAPLLEFANRAIVVQPKQKTLNYAKQKNFEIW